MQFATFATFLAAMAAITPAVMACNQAQDCCWGGKDNGYSGCKNQHHGAAEIIGVSDHPCTTELYAKDFCSKRGVTVAQCDADCCQISTGFGRACPK
ncbi:hypothetical protein IFR05_002729 [Cadophora sp. M221]|nr:hypothetical protein IFR05_002729 [Cadophora sp. M221]